MTDSCKHELHWSTTIEIKDDVEFGTAKCANCQSFFYLSLYDGRYYIWGTEGWMILELPLSREATNTVGG